MQMTCIHTQGTAGERRHDGVDWWIYILHGASSSYFSRDTRQERSATSGKLIRQPRQWLCHAFFFNYWQSFGQDLCSEVSLNLLAGASERDTNLALASSVVKFNAICRSGGDECSWDSCRLFEAANGRSVRNALSAEILRRCASFTHVSHHKLAYFCWGSG